MVVDTTLTAATVVLVEVVVVRVNSESVWVWRCGQRKLRLDVAVHTTGSSVYVAVTVDPG